MYRLLETLELVEGLEDQITKGLMLLAMKGATRDWYNNYPTAAFKKGELLVVNQLKGRTAYVEVQGTKRASMVSVAALANLMGRKILQPLAAGEKRPFLGVTGYKKTPSTVPLAYAEEILVELLSYLDEDVADEVMEAYRESASSGS